MCLVDLGRIAGRQAGKLEGERSPVRGPAWKGRQAQWNDDHLSELPWLALRGILTPVQGPGHLAQTWPTFLDRLSAPITPELLATHALFMRYLEPVSTNLSTTRHSP